MYSVSPSQIELFHLRLLLLTVKGATSFENLRTVDGNLCGTFTEACIALGLINDDNEWSKALHEGEVWMMPKALRRLFIRILIHCQPLHPEKLWEEFKDVMSEDYLNTCNDLSQARLKALEHINFLFQIEGKSLKDFPTMPKLLYEREYTEEEISVQDAFKKGMSQYETLNDEQKYVIDVILNYVDNGSTKNGSNCFYIDGPGGSGKTYIYNTLWHLLAYRRKVVCTMAFTGIAATLLPNGRIVHKVLGLPIPLYQDSTSSIKLGTKEAKYLEKMCVVIWDEAPMAPRYALENMDRLMKFIMNNNLPFGGKVVVLGGDDKLLLPVLLKGTRSETVNLSIKRSHLWNLFKIFKLTVNMRALPEEKEFMKFHLDVGNGNLNDELDNIELPSHCIKNNDLNIAEDIYKDRFSSKQYKKAAKNAILSARNVDVDAINNQVVELLDIATERLYTSVDSVENCNQTDEINIALLPEYLNTLSPMSLPPHELRLRQFSVVMLIRNLSINEGLCNGTRLIILELKNHLLRCEILTGDKAGRIVFLNRITFYCENEYPFSFSRRKFPIKLAFAITINNLKARH